VRISSALSATASSINKLASGIGDDIVGTLFLAHENRARY